MITTRNRTEERVTEEEVMEKLEIYHILSIIQSTQFFDPFT